MNAGQRPYPNRLRQWVPGTRLGMTALTTRAKRGRHRNYALPAVGAMGWPPAWAFWDR
jgi:hypothetical protein